MGKIVQGGCFQFGIQDIDRRNRRFIEKFNELIDVIQKEKDWARTRTLLAGFADYVNQHFRFEEGYLRDRLDDLEYLDHKERHMFFEDFLRTPILNTGGGNHLDTKELSDFLADWLFFHLRHLDRSSFCSTGT